MSSSAADHELDAGGEGEGGGGDDGGGGGGSGEASDTNNTHHEPSEIELQVVTPFLFRGPGDTNTPQSSTSLCDKELLQTCLHPEGGQQHQQVQQKMDAPAYNSRGKWRSRLAELLHTGKRKRKSKTPETSGSCPCDGPLKESVVHLKINGRTGIDTETILLTNAVADGTVKLPSTTPNGQDLTQTTNLNPERETWDKKIDFLLSIIGFAVDLANVWRFPYLCYKNGGGAFLIPYALMLIFGAVPLFYMELILGQFHRQGPISLWKICPLFKGAGYCAVLVAFYVSFYYNVVIGWSFYFMFASFTSELPWTHCNNSWNTKQCWDKSKNWTRGSVIDLSHGIGTGVTAASWRMGNLTQNSSTISASAAVEYFERRVLELHKSEGVHDLGYPKWELCLCALLAYFVLYLALFKGVKASGKVVWVTATMPYVILSILFVRGLMLPGATQGLLYFLSPQVDKLKDTQVWVDAAVQVFYSVGVGFGVHLSYASYNNFHNNCRKDCLITVGINSFTSFYSGLVIFTYLGYMSETQKIHISKVATDGPGLVFQVYPEAIATLPGSNVWAFLFFFMLITLGMDSSMGGLESVITGIKDEFHTVFRRYKYSREIFTGLLVSVSFLVALLNLTRGGGYMLQWFDTYSAGLSLLCSALFEAVAVSWFYGMDRFCDDIAEMLGSRPGFFWRIAWKLISPGFLVAVIVFAVVFHQPLKYNNYIYPYWIEMVGWGYALSPVIVIPLVAIYVIYRQKGTLKQRIAYAITPEDELHILRTTGQVTRYKGRHWISV